MIKFFRKIRYNLMNENKTGKPTLPPVSPLGRSGRYFKYAIGEIILVVIGILIALQINNWNTERIERKKEENYLINIKRDLNKQLVAINRNLNGEEFIYQSLTKAKDNYKKHKKFRALQEDFVLLAPMNDRFTFIITSPTYTELLSTGNLDLISNADIKTQIVQYYEDLELTSKVIQKNNDYKDNVISSKTLSIFEVLGGSSTVSIEKIYRGMQQSFNDYETPEELLTIIKPIISKPENQLTILNLLRFKRTVAYLHVNRLKEAKIKTETLLSLLND